MIDLPPPSHEQTVQAVASRGVARSKILIEYQDYDRSWKLLECVMQMFTASGAGDHGIRFVFVGNEALVEEKK